MGKTDKTLGLWLGDDHLHRRVQNRKFCVCVIGLTCQNIAHDGIPQEGNVVDNVPQAFEVCKDVVHRVRRRFQGRFDPGEEFRC